MLEMNKAYSLNNNLILKGINDKFWALDTKTGLQYRLNECSYDILSTLDGKTTVEQIIENQFKKYNVEKSILINDIMSFLESAYKKGFIF